MSTSSIPSASDLRVTDDALARSLAYCRGVTRRRARNFYYGMKLTPEPKRSAMYAIYAWMRAADDLADASEPSPSESLPGASVRERVAATQPPGEGTPPQSGRSTGSQPSDGPLTPALSPTLEDSLGAGAGANRPLAIETFRRQTSNALSPDAPCPDGPIWPAVRQALLDYRVPAEYLHAMIDGQLLDQCKSRYAAFAELHDYCYKVASTVGLVCITIWGYDGEASTRQMAIDRGIALQLTNILRDLVEDAGRDRIYLPADELAAAGLTEQSFKNMVLSGDAGTKFDALMRPQIERAQTYYDRSVALEARVDAACRPTCWAMMRIYHGLLEKIAADPRRVLRQRVRLSGIEKAGIALRATWRKGTGKNF